MYNYQNIKLMQVQRQKNQNITKQYYIPNYIRVSLMSRGKRIDKIMIFRMSYLYDDPYITRIK